MVRCAHRWVIQGRVGTFRQTDLCCATVACSNTPLMELKEQIRATAAQGRWEEEQYIHVDLQRKQEVTNFWWLLCKCECCCLFFLSCLLATIHTIGEYFTHALCIGLWVGHHTACVLALPRQLQGSVPWQTCWTHCNWVSYLWSYGHNSP